MKRLFVLCLAVVAFVGCEDEFGFDKAKIELSRSDFDGTYWTFVHHDYVQYVNGKAAGLIEDMNDEYPYPDNVIDNEVYRYYYENTLKVYTFRSYEDASTASTSVYGTNIDIDNKLLNVLYHDGYNREYGIITLTADTMRLAEPIVHSDSNSYYRCINTYVRVRPDAALMDRFANATMSDEEQRAFWKKYFAEHYSK